MIAAFIVWGVALMLLVLSLTLGRRRREAKEWEQWCRDLERHEQLWNRIYPPSPRSKP